MAPNRFEIEPVRIAELLPETFILERFGSERFNFRLAGTRICENFGQELRGQNFFDGFSDVDKAQLQQDFTEISLRGGISLIQIEAKSDGDLIAQFESLTLPLIHTSGRVDRCLGCISGVELPPRIGDEVLIEKRLLHREIIWPDGRPNSFVDELKQKLPFVSHAQEPRIVRNNRRQFRVFEGGLSCGTKDKEF